MKPTAKRLKTYRRSTEPDQRAQRIQAAEEYMARTREAFAHSIEAGRQLGAAGRGVLAGPLVKRRAAHATR